MRLILRARQRRIEDVPYSGRPKQTRPIKTQSWRDIQQRVKTERRKEGSALNDTGSQVTVASRQDKQLIM